MTELTIPVEELSTVLNKAILDALSAETRNRLIEGALKHLLTAPPPDRYGSAKPVSPLQQQFEYALNGIAREVAEEVLNAEGVRAQLTEKFGEVLARVESLFDSPYDAQSLLVDVLAQRVRDLRER